MTRCARTTESAVFFAHDWAAGQRTRCPRRISPGSYISRRAVLLLEVVVALCVMVLAMGLLGAQLISGLKMTAYAEEQTRATHLAERMLALVELDPNAVERFFEQRELDGDFDSDIYPEYRGWFWRARVEELPNNQELGRVTIEILHQTDPKRLDDADTAQVVRELHLLKAHPGRVDLAKDFGVPQEQLDMLLELIPVPGFDPTALDPQAIVSLDQETLLGLLPVLLPLLQQFGGGSIPSEYSPDMLRELLTGDLSAGGLPLDGEIPGLEGGGELAGIRALLESELGGQLSQEELESLLSQVGQGGGGALLPGGDLPPGATPRRGLGIEDLAGQRQERNRRSRER